ncbi:MAG: class I SAM-dependent methyltransferase [Chloroflexota bacterium]
MVQIELSKYPSSDIPPSSLIGLYGREFDGISFFYSVMQPHLLMAHSKWRAEIDKSAQGHENCERVIEKEKVWLNPVLLTHLRMIYEFSFTGLHVEELIEHKPLINFEGLYKDPGAFNYVLDVLSKVEPDVFHADIFMDPRGQGMDAKDIGNAYLTCEGILNYKRWRNFYSKTVIPFAMEFDDPVPTFPQAIVAGDLVWEKRFDRYLLPTFVKNPKYRDRFYRYFAEKYESQTDMAIKKGVFASLFRLMPGNDITILDAGSGTSLGFLNQPGDRTIRMLGVDASPEMVSIAQSRGANVSVGNIEDVARDSNGYKFDYAMASFVDYWVAREDKVNVYIALRKVVKSDGRVVFNVHKPQDGWEEEFRKLLIDECGYKSVSFSQELIERTGGGVYTAYYVSAEV